MADPATNLDRALGAVFGGALGDALGLPAEGCLKSILDVRYPAGLALPHAAPCRGFPLNDWTDDTDHVVLVMRTLRAHALGQAADPAADFAGRLAGWSARGFPELGDTEGQGCGGLTGRLLRAEGFLRDPFASAAALLGPKAGNGALMRTAPCAFTADPAGWARYLAQTTHADPRSTAACVAQTLLVRELAAVAPAAPIPAACLARPLRAALEGLSAKHRAEVLRWVGRAARLEDLELDGRDERGYALKSLGCAVWAFRQLAAAPPAARDAALFKALVGQIAAAGGDADTNAAIAGAVVGAAVGFRALPADWLAALPHRAWLGAEARAWLVAGRPPPPARN